jgi:LmbE family N-acetylglucosaminyl deacetylase
MRSETLTELLSRNRPQYLNDLQLPGDLRVAVLAPHPDDFDAIGITLRYFRDRGNRIDVAVLTSGASGVENGFGGALTPAAKALVREDEQRASCRFFGLPEDWLTFLRLTEDEEGHPEESTANIERVGSYLLAKLPELVFMPHGNDSNPGHQRTYATFARVAREEGLAVLALLNRDPKTIAMRHDLCMVFNAEAAAWKGELLRFHQSQHQRNLNTRRHGFDERILSVNRRIAEELGRNGAYAEAFEFEGFGPPEGKA